jgi:hypothetical protein
MAFISASVQLPPDVMRAVSVRAAMPVVELPGRLRRPVQVDVGDAARRDFEARHRPPRIVPFWAAVIWPRWAADVPTPMMSRSVVLDASPVRSIRMRVV